MADFEPRMDKWRSGPVVEDLGLQFKDAILNKGRLEKERAAARAAAERRARWNKSFLGRIWNLVKTLMGLAILGFCGWLLYSFVMVITGNAF